MQKRELIFDGKEKQLFATDNHAQVILNHKDVMMAYNNVKCAVFKGKGELNNRISALLLEQLNLNGVATHFIEILNDREQLCRKVDVIPIEVIVRNRIAGSLCDRLGIEEGIKPEQPIIDLRYNNDELADPLINDYHAIALNLVNGDELALMYRFALKANDIIGRIFHEVNIELVDMKLEFGRPADNGDIIVADEISPDTCRLWEEKTGNRLDKDRYRRDLGGVISAYQDVYERLYKLLKNK